MKNEKLEEAISFLEQIYEDRDALLLQMAGGSRNYKLVLSALRQAIDYASNLLAELNMEWADYLEYKKKEE
jgi:hypothetical protein